MSRNIAFLGVTALVAIGAAVIAAQFPKDNLGAPAIAVAQVDEMPAVGMCSKTGSWTCSTGTCVKVDSSSGQCCPSGYPKYSRVGFCKK
jgi:hypothetical protein